MYNSNIIGYISYINFNPDPKNFHLVRMNLWKGLEQSYGFHLRKDNFIEKLPIWVSKQPILKWYEKDVIFNSADKGTTYQKDKDFLKECLIYTCLTENNKCMSLEKNNLIILNELCFDKNTISLQELKKYTLTIQEKELLKLYNKIIDYVVKTVKNYNQKFTYGVYQIKKELNTSYTLENSTNKIYDYPELWQKKKRDLYANTCYSSISSAFNWSNTNEGHEFWKLINEKWIIFRKNLLLKQN